MVATAAEATVTFSNRLLVLLHLQPDKGSGLRPGLHDHRELTLASFISCISRYSHRRPHKLTTESITMPQHTDNITPPCPDLSWALGLEYFSYAHLFGLANSHQSLEDSTRHLFSGAFPGPLPGKNCPLLCAPAAPSSCLLQEFQHSMAQYYTYVLSFIRPHHPAQPFLRA